MQAAGVFSCLPEKPVPFRPRRGCLYPYEGQERQQGHGNSFLKGGTLWIKISSRLSGPGYAGAMIAQAGLRLLLNDAADALERMERAAPVQEEENSEER
jgi:hypothetical protein